MTVELSVHEVRRALLSHAAGSTPGEGCGANLVGGRIFHEVFADLVGTDPRRSGLRLIVESGADEDATSAELLAFTWQRLLGPRLLNHAAVLRESGAEVVVLWSAVKALSRWLVHLVRELVACRPEATGQWELLTASIRSEVPLSRLLRRPGWTEPVLLTGIADAIITPGQGAKFCAVELKLGRGAPSADLAQAALYHLMLSEEKELEASSLAVVRFSPAPLEMLVAADRIADAQVKLLDLIGELAGVVPQPKPEVVVSECVPPRAEGPLERYRDLGRGLQRAYAEQGLRVKLPTEPECGPRFLRYALRLEPGTKIEAVRRAAPEIAHRLELCVEPQLVRDGGRLYVDVARPDPCMVPFSSILPQLPKSEPRSGSALLPIGVDPAGQLRFADLASAGRSHVLVAGTTGSGKTEWLRMATAGLIAQNTPETLRLVTFDPKLSAFAELEQSRFLLSSDSFWIPGGEHSAVELFHRLIEEMERRYQAARSVGVDNLTEYVKKTERPLPRILVLCDEYFALMAVGKQEKQELELAVGLLGAKARASGIHLVLATQLPNRATVTAPIATNLPCRVALLLQSAIESRMMLGRSGAEQLTGSGDLLYKDFGDPVRLQAPYLPEAERRRFLGG